MPASRSAAVCSAESSSVAEDRKDYRVRGELRELRELRDHRDRKERQDLRVRSDRKVRLAQLDRLDPKGSKVRQVLAARVPRAKQEPLYPSRQGHSFVLPRKPYCSSRSKGWRFDTQMYTALAGEVPRMHFVCRLLQCRDGN